MENIIFVGPQGSGKGTQAKIIAEKLGYVHLSTGDIFRAEIAKGTELGKLAASLINDGNLVPDDVTNEIVISKIKELNSQGKYVILDGYPRSIPQAEALIESGYQISYIVNIMISDEESVKRLSARYSCSECKKQYNLLYSDIQPKVEGICDVCQGKLVQRDDDKPDAIKKRLDIYHAQINPILDLFKDKVVEINGAQLIENVTEDILKFLQ